MHERADIVIAGSGLNGCCLALALCQSGFHVVLVDPVSNSRRYAADFDGRGYALAISSKQMLTALGVWEQFARHTQPMLEIKVSDGRPGEGASPFVLEFDHREIEEGPMGYMVEDRHIRRALMDRCAEERLIDVREGTKVVGESVNASNVTVELEGGQKIDAGLLVACDGKNSAIAVRAGIRKSRADYDQKALVCAVEHEHPHRGVAHQFFMPNGPLAILPLTQNRCSIVWAENAEQAERISALDNDAFLAALRPRFGSFLGEITLAGERFSYPLGLSIADRFISERCALVGDAAHWVHPLAGQGLNAGFKDVAALAEVLTNAKRRGEDIGRSDVLDRYQKWRRFDVATLAMATDGFNRLFSNDTPALRLVRDFGLGAVNALPDLRRLFIREAAGLTGDMPKLLRGIQI